MKSTFKIGRIKVSGETVNHVSSRILDNETKLTTDKSPIYVELNDIEVCYEDFTASDVVTIGKEVGSMVFSAVKESIELEAQQREHRRQIQKQEEDKRREMNRRAAQSRRDKRNNRLDSFSAELARELSC